MTELNIDRLLGEGAVDSRYTLVILAAKRAREINSYYSQLGEGRGEFVPPLIEGGLGSSPWPSPSRRSTRARSPTSGPRRRKQTRPS